MERNSIPSMNTPTEVREVPLEDIRFFIRRAREKEGFEAMKESMDAIGLRYPIQVRDLGRKQSDGKRYELICGEGRVTAATDLKWKTIPALIVEAGHEEIAGRFLAENMIRKPLPWAQKGRLVRDLMRTGKSYAEVAAELLISEGHARKFLRILNKASTAGLEDDVAELPIAEAEVLTALPAKGQKLVMDVSRDTNIPIRDVTNVARKLEKQSPEGWTKGALEAALRKVDDDLAAVRKRLKVLRLHHALGPQNVRQLMKSKEFMAAAESAKLNLSKLTE